MKHFNQSQGDQEHILFEASDLQYEMTAGHEEA
jgi:hypothetical protein